MRKKEVFIIIVLFLISGMFLVSSTQEIKNKVSEDVYSALEENEEVSIIVKVKTKETFFGKNNLEKVRENVREDLGDVELREYKDLISMNVSEEGLEKLSENPDVERISYSHQISSFLQDSIPLINASVVWPIQVNGINITGIDETVCVLDTGINFSHSDLIGKNKTCVIDCFNKNCVENCSVSDDNGHGTHVAGIVSASGGIFGVGANISLIGLKVLNSGGSGSDTAELDLTNAIDWCIQNREAHNISVISMSLGTNAPYFYDIECDGSYSAWTTAINNATAHNISVIVATGNDYNSTHISSPACITNSTAVGATDKSDSVASYSNRNSLTDFFAPGSSINSTMVLSPSGTVLTSCGTGNLYCSLSGTSMATPHVAGAFVLIRQFFRLQENRVPIPSEISDILNSTGKQINDVSSGLSFSRVDIYSAIDSIIKTVSVVFSPANNTFINQANQNKTFVCNSTSTNYDLTNTTFSLWNSTSDLLYNLTTDISGTSNSTNFNYNFSVEDVYAWNCVAYNNQSFSNSDENYTITYDATYPNITLVSPFPTSETSSSVSKTFYYNVSDDYGVANCSLVINGVVDSTNSSITNLTQPHSFSKTVTPAVYVWSVNCTDNANNQNNSEEKSFTITTPATVTTSSSGGGGGGGGSATISGQTYSLPSIITSVDEGATQEIKKEDKILFSIPTSSSDKKEHTIKPLVIAKNYVKLEIKSEPINATIYIGETKNLDLDGDDFDDLIIKLNSINNGKANLTIKTFNEINIEAGVTGNVVEEKVEEKAIPEDEKVSDVLQRIKDVLLVVLIVAVLVILFVKFDKREKSIKKYKEKFNKEIKPSKKK